MAITKTVLPVTILLLTLLLQGCGRKGPLFIQSAPPPAATTPAEQKPVNSDQVVPNPSEIKK